MIITQRRICHFRKWPKNRERDDIKSRFRKIQKEICASCLKLVAKKLDILHQEPLTRIFRFKMAHFEPEYPSYWIIQSKQLTAEYAEDWKKNK